MKIMSANQSSETTSGKATAICTMRLLVCSFMLVLLVALVASPYACSSPAPTPIESQAGYNNLENLISEFLDDAGDRLKKSKLNGARQVKQTLRFGRRSDPLFGFSNPEQMSLEELQNRLYGLD